MPEKDGYILEFRQWVDKLLESIKKTKGSTILIFAQKAGMSDRDLRHIANGTTEVRLEHVYNIAKALGCKPSCILWEIEQRQENHFLDLLRFSKKNRPIKR